MAEQEVIKHTKNVFKIWANKESSFWHKVKELLLEIFIIVFAVSLSIWLHGWSVHRHEQKQVKTFLLGLKKDIQSDKRDVKNLIEFWNNRDEMFSYLSNLKKLTKPNEDSLKLMTRYIQGSNYLTPHQTRFNGFVSAGKILTIENDSLVQNIMQYYQEVIPELKAYEGGWLKRHEEIKKYIMNCGVDTDMSIDYYNALITPQGKALTKSLIPSEHFLEKNENVIRKGDEIIAAIDRMYPDEASQDK